MTTAEKIEVMQAFVDGKEIQIKEKRANRWEEVTGYEPDWDWSFNDYRVKPEEEKPERMTEEELIEWCARGYGLITCGYKDGIESNQILWESDFASWETDLKKEANESIRIRHFGTDECLIPTRDIFIKDCTREDCE